MPTKISQMSSASALTGTELVPLVQSGGNVRGTVSELSGAFPLADYTALRAFSGAAKSVYVTGYLATSAPSGIAGLFTRDDSDTTSADNGATIIVDSSGRRWKRPVTGAVQAAWWDLDVTGATDMTDKIQSALTYAYNVALQSNWISQSARIELPRGSIKVAQPNVLFSGLTGGIFVIDGQGGGTSATELVYDVAAPASTDYMVNNDDTFAFTLFRGVGFRCPNAGTNQQFMNYNSSGTAQRMTFESCSFDGPWGLLFDVKGSANASENTFINCRLTGFVNGFKFNNQQSVNWRFYATDIESFTGVLFDYVKGATVLVSQGSIIPSASTARVVRVPATASDSAFGQGNAPQLLCHGPRFEIRNGAALVEKLNSAVFITLVFDGCGMGGANIVDPATTKPIIWYGGGQLVFKHCRNMGGYRMAYTLSAPSSSQQLSVVAEYCSLPTDFVTASAFSITGSNVGYAPIFSIRGSGSAVDGIYRHVDAQVISGAGGIAQQRRAVTFSSEANTIAYSSGSAVQTLTLPPVRLQAIDLYPTANAGYAGFNATITVTNAAGTTTLATFTYDMGAPSVRYTADVSYFVDAMAGDSLKFTIAHDHGSTTLVFRGSMYLTY